MAMQGGGSDFNWGKYRQAFSNNSTKKDFAKTTPLKFTPASENVQIQAGLGFRRESYPTPIHPQGKGR